MQDTLEFCACVARSRKVLSGFQGSENMHKYLVTTSELCLAVFDSKDILRAAE